jgi:guanylate kinase
MHKPVPRKDKIIIVSAPSGAGKSTVVNHLLSAGLGLEFSVSATSRAMREGEINGREYYFMTADEFRKKIKNNELLEWQEVYAGSFYGTPKSEVERIHANGHIPIFDLDVVGGLNVKKMFGEKALALFIQPPSVEVLEQRLRSRKSDSEENLRKRLDKAAWELEFAPEFDKILVNGVLEVALKNAENVVREFLDGKSEASSK